MTTSVLNNLSFTAKKSQSNVPSAV